MNFLIKNKKAYFDYEILEEYTAGVQLTGAEVKSVRAGHAKLSGAYASIQGGQAWLKGAHISRYAYDSTQTHDPLRDRKLLLKKSEVERLAAKLNTEGVTLVALGIGTQGRFIKVVIGLARGKKKHDKRRTIKERMVKREVERAIRRR